MDFEKIGKYKIPGELGSGAMGVVYRAHDPILDRHVAIKMISSALGVVGGREMLERIFGTDIPDEITDHRSPVAKGRVVWWHENYKMVMDSLGLCFIPVAATTIYGEPLILIEELGEIYQALTGKDPKTLFAAGERAYQVETSFNALLGISRKDDCGKGPRAARKTLSIIPACLMNIIIIEAALLMAFPPANGLRRPVFQRWHDDLALTGKIADRECPAIEELIGR